MGVKINKPSQTTYWVASSPGVVHYGQTEPNQVTTSGQASFEVCDDEDDQLTKLGPHAAKLPPFPAIGQPADESRVYNQGGNPVKCKISTIVQELDPHDRGDYFRQK
jgi:hypothetical protein